MALRWLKPLEQGIDVKIAAGTHGGCMRVFDPPSIPASTSLRISRARSSPSAISPVPTRTSFSIQLAKQGIDPNRDCRPGAPIPGNLLNLAVEKEEVPGVLSSIRSPISG